MRVEARQYDSRVTGYDPTDLAAQQRAMDERDKSSRDAARILSDDVSRVMSSKSGRRFVAYLLGEAGAYQSCFDTNALNMARMNGERNVALRLMALIQAACPDRYFEMLQEHLKNERSSSDGRNVQ